MYNNIKFYTPPQRTRWQHIRLWWNIIPEVIRYAISDWWQTLRHRSIQLVKQTSPMLNYKPFETFIERKFNPSLEPETLKTRLTTEIYNTAFRSGQMLSLPMKRLHEIVERETLHLPEESQLQLRGWLKVEMARYIVKDNTYAITESELVRLVTGAISQINR
jgi:hypothetical protein